MPVRRRPGSLPSNASFRGEETKMDRLSILLTLMTGSVLVGGPVIAVLTMGYYSWQPIVGAIAVGLLLTWPAAYAISRWIKLKDPAWRLRSGAPNKKSKPQSDFPET